MNDPAKAAAALKKKQGYIDRLHEKDVSATEKRLAASYRASYKTLEAELAKLYASSAGDIAEARKYGRLKAMEAAINTEYKKLTGKTIKETESSAAQSYATGTYGSQWAVDQSIGVNVKWPILPVNAIRESVNAEIVGEDFRTRTIYNETYSAEQARRHVTQGLATGSGYAKTARKLREDVDVSYSDAVRIVRTESARDFILGKLQTTESLKDIGITTKKQWVATPYGDYRKTHLAADGQISDEDGMFHVSGVDVEGPGLFGDPAEDCNCRCSYIDVIEGYEPEFLERYEDGTFSSESYTEWAKSIGWTEAGGFPKAKEARQ
jgi:hypothetical protein